MELLQHAFGLLTGTIIPFLVVLTLIVFVHEMGHYLAGRWSGIGITAFSIGFGPEIAGFTDRRGTRWKLSAIPLGGYVKFLGDEDAASTPDYDKFNRLPEDERARTFLGAALWKRAVTVAAGPIANFVLAIAIFSRGLRDLRPAGRRSGRRGGARIERRGRRPASCRATCSLRIDGAPVRTFDDVRRYVSVRPEIPIVVTIRRNGAEQDLRHGAADDGAHRPVRQQDGGRDHRHRHRPRRPAISAFVHYGRSRPWGRASCRAGTSSPAPSTISPTS